MPNKTRKSLNIKKKKIICVACKTEVLESDEAMECDSCNKTLHSLCTQLNKVQIEKLINNPSLEFKCQICEPCDESSSDIKTMLKEMREMRSTMNFMSSQYDTILKGVKKNTADVKKLQKENDILREDVKKLKSTVMFLNDIRVQNNCIINGVVAESQENAVDVVLNIAKKSGADVCEDDIDDAYFLGRSKHTNKSAVVVKFVNNKSKTIFMKEKKKLNTLEGMKSVFVNDFLSKDSLELFKHAKSLKSVGFTSVFTSGGRIFVKRNVNSRQIRIRNMDDVDQLLLKSTNNRIKPVRGTLNEPVLDDDDDDDDEFDDADAES